MKERVAIIDIGTLKTKCTVAAFDKHLHRETLYKDKFLTVIGRNIQKTNNIITEASIQTQLDALKTCMKTLQTYKVSKYRVIGTEALRKAINAKTVLNQLQNITQSTIDILTHEEEAAIYFHAIANDIKGKIAVADIGGGSVQLTIGNQEKINAMHLLKTGTYYLQTAYAKTHLPTHEENIAAWHFVKDEIAKQKIHKHPQVKFIYGSTNIIDFFTETKIPLKCTNLSHDHPYKANITELQKLYDKLIRYSFEERQQFFLTEPYFMWGADKALMNILIFAEFLQVSEIIPSNMNVSDGLLLQLAVH
jgi:exopolyphosphatase/guanosine-5'-triphosphate,3'-diphosphate pyrophosphatase